MFENYIIKESASIKEAFVALNRIPGIEQTLFVVNDESRMVGTVTDGDIRRGIIAGASLDSEIAQIMHHDFHYFEDGKIDLYEVRRLRSINIILVPVLDGEKRVVEILNLADYRSFLPVDAVLMAGGKGERLRPLTEKTPKPLLKIGNKAIIDHNVERLAAFGVKNIFVTVNYLAEQIEEHFKSPVGNVMVKTVREPDFFGTIGSVKFVKELEHDVVLVMNSDLFTNIDYEDFYLHFIENDADMSVAAVPYDVSIPFGVFELDGRKICGIKEKPTYHYYANAGIYLIKKSVLNLIPEATKYNATDLIEKLIALKMNVIRFPITGYWIDIGQHSELKKAEEFTKHLK